MLLEEQERVSPVPLRRARARPFAAPRVLAAPVRTLPPRPVRVEPPPNLDVRLHAPIPRVVIVLIVGVVDRSSVALLIERVSQQLDRAAHVVLDLGGVEAIGALGVGALCDLDRAATIHHSMLHLAGADNDVLHDAGLDQLLPIVPSADGVVALLRHQTRQVTELR